MIATNDKVGFQSQQNIKAAYAYHVPLNEKSTLSLGISGGILHTSIDRSKLNPANPFDPNPLTWDQTSAVTPDFDFGAEYKYDKLTVGFAIAHLLETTNDQLQFSLGRNYYGYAEYKIRLNEKWELTPSFFLQKYRKSMAMEWNTLAMWKEKYWVGASFRVGTDVKPESLIAMAGLNITNFLRLGYSYDFNLNGLNSKTGGSHEILLIARLKKL